MVGDYLFDSTVNGVYDSADFATGILITELRRAAYAIAQDDLAPSDANDGALGAGYHDEYADESLTRRATPSTFANTIPPT